ncbi:hypothetical protein I7I48_05110 [Histoplasma ohiense]|nr:hypothetical protein I7I48_05110 [Histoplasma ohiense (nom. inval.)]
MKLIILYIEIIFLMQQVLAINEDEFIHTSNNEVVNKHLASYPQNINDVEVSMSELDEKPQQSAPAPNLLDIRFIHCHDVQCANSYQCLVETCGPCVGMDPTQNGYCTDLI